MVSPGPKAGIKLQRCVRLGWALLVCCFTLFAMNTLRAGSILREVWEGVSGTAVSQLTSDPRFPNAPSSTNLVSDYFEAPTDVLEDYGQRMHGYILPPVTGNYTFWIATDDGGELWLSTDETPANQRQIAYVSGWTSSREWTREANQQSAPIRLESGRAYYVSALQKEGGGGDNLAVRWLRPDGVDEAPIPATYLLPWGTAFAVPSIQRQPQSTSVVEGGAATFDVQADPLSPANVQWQRNGIDIAGASTNPLVYGPVRMSDQNSRFRAVLSNRLGTTVSEDATLAVTPDVTAPTVAVVRNLSAFTVSVAFDEPMELSSLVNPGNYKISGGIQITGASGTADGRSVILSTSSMVFGNSYTVTISNLRDQAASSNGISPGTARTFVAVEYVPWDIGVQGGTTTTVAGGFNLATTSEDLGDTTDQCHFAYQQRTGDFDMRVRLATLGISDPFVQAGLMARENLDASARFLGVFASSAQVGCFVESRSTASSKGKIIGPVGGFPVNYPRMWLRLRRSGNQFTGFASFDGSAWQELGTASLTLPQTLFFGMTLAGHDAKTSSVAQFRDLGPTVAPTSFTYPSGRERMGPSSRRTGLVFSEIMYHPATRSDSRNLEFIELYNAESVFVDLTGWRLTGGIDYTFPDGFKLQAGQFAVVAAVPADLQSVYGTESVLGPFTGRLDSAGDTLRLLNRAGALCLEVTYSPDAPWPVAADGHGHSLVLARPSFGENDPRAWSASEQRGGSPGEVDAIALNPWQGVLINEILAHTDDPVLDFVELYNSSRTVVDLGGCFLSDDPSTNRFRIPNGTTLPPGGFIAFDQNQLGFALSAKGETLYLLAADQSRVIDVIRFGGQENSVSSGRAPDGAPGVRRLQSPSPGRANAARRIEDVVINEVMYHPITGLEDDQYVELYNTSGVGIDLSGWRLTSGIGFQFPSGTVLAPNGYAVVAKDATRLRDRYPQLNAGNTYGNFSGKLSRASDRVVLTKPDTIVSTNQSGALETNRIHISISEMAYRDGGRWPELADGGGSSLELIDPRADLLAAPSWKASDETQKASWQSYEFTGRLDLANTGYPNNRLHIIMLGAGECLIDDVEVLGTASTNLLSNGSFESGVSGWTFYGNHRGSTVDSAGSFAGQNCLHVRGLGDGDTGNNAIRVNLLATLPSSQNATLRAKVRWLAGWPEVLLRVRGGGIEMPVHMTLPTNLGTPGAPNSRRLENAGPAIYEVSHAPALPRANQAVVVTCRVADPDGVASPRLRYRVDPAATLTTGAMRDDGTGGDAQAGDGVYSATISGRSSGTLVAFRIEANDDSASAPMSVFPAEAPSRECLIRWDDPIPMGSFAHYHMWNTAAIDQARNSSRPLDNTYRDCTLVYGDSRIVYNAGFRDKGSPYHGGSGDFAVAVPTDDLVLGAQDRVFGSTGNGGNEATQMKGDVSGWIGQQLDIPFLHSHYLRLYRNGGLFREVLYDLEQPNSDYAHAWFGGGDPGDQLYKIAVWFEFADDNSNFQSTGATLERFLSSGVLKPARYRWNWQLRPSGTTATDLQPIFNLVTAANNVADRVTGLMNVADMEEWMRVFAYNRILGNWDSWTFSVGQNMYLYAPLGGRATLLPWDIDFVLGDGNGPSDPLWGGQDPVVNQLYNVPAYRRMLWRAYQDAVNGPLRAENYAPQVEARRRALLNNGVSSNPNSIRTYIEARRNYLQTQLKTADAAAFSLSTNGGTEYSTNNPVASLTGLAPFAVVSIDVNGSPYPVTWISATAWRMDVPLGAAVNRLELIGRDRHGRAVPGATASITVRYTGAAIELADWVVINEIMYHPPEKNGEFIELFNRHPNASFDLSGLELHGADFQFPSGVVIPPGGFLLVVKDRSVFTLTYGAQLPVVGEFNGNLNNGGETIRLVKPASEVAPERVIDDVRYDSSPPWPALADGLGASLQLSDPTQDNWRVGNWSALASSDPNRATPGRANGGLTSIDPFPSLWINEVLPDNRTINVDAQGEHAPWIELFNAGLTPIDLTGFYLSSDPNNLRQWAVPQGTVLSAGSFLLVWADGQTANSAPGELHASFRLNSTNGVLTLSRNQAGAAVVMDFVRYTTGSSDRATGSVPDGEPRKRKVLLIPTPGGPNNPNSPAIPVSINEWVASNRSGLVDPVDGAFDDWFELFNAGANTVDLSGFFLTDALTNSTKFKIPPGTTIPANSYRVFWADNESAQNGVQDTVHTNFRLSADGGQIGLASPDGVLLDSVTFPVQTPDISQGRVPDGGAPPFAFFSNPTPGLPNAGQSGNRPPTLSPIGDKTIEQGQTLQITALASDPDVPAQALTFDLTAAPAGATIDSQSGQLTWTPASSIPPGSYWLTVRVTDNGVPPRAAAATFQVLLRQINVAPKLAPVPNAVIDESVPFTFRVSGSDANLPPQKLTYSLGIGSPEGVTIDAATGEFTWVPSEAQGPGVYTISLRVTDDGQPPLSTEQSVTLTVMETNNAPTLVPIAAQNVDEGSALSLQVEARDPDNPPVRLSFSLENSPAGARINSDTGVFQWTPAERDGPRDYNITVRATEAGGGPSSTMTFLVGVREVNLPPVLTPIPRLILRPGDSLVWTNQATDADFPPQGLTFSAVTGLPPGANLNPSTGILSWTLGDDPVAGTNRIVIRVTDDAVPPLSSEQVAELVVQAPPRVAINEVMHRPAVANAQFVELVNLSRSNPVDLSGWRMEGYNFLFPSGILLEPRGYLCVARDVSAFQTAYGKSARVVGNAVIVLPADGGSIKLLQPGVASGESPWTIDDVHFRLSAPWPESAITAGASLQRIDAQQDPRPVANWDAAKGNVTNSPVAVVPLEATWRSWQAAGSPGTAWNSAAYDDTAWPSGSALFYVETAAIPGTKNTPLTLGSTTYYFRTRFNFVGDPKGALLRLTTILDDGAIFYLNGQEIYRLGMPTGAVDQSTFAARTVGDAAQEGPQEVPALGLRSGENVIAVEVHQVNAGSSDIVFGAAVDLISIGASSFTPGALNSVAAELPPFPSLWINEILPGNGSGLPDNFQDREPWVELYHDGSAPLRLDDWSLSDDYAALGRWPFPAGTVIAPHSYLLIWMDGEVTESTASSLHANFRLAPTSGRLALARLQSGGRRLVDYVEYAQISLDQSWGALPDGDPLHRQILDAPSPGHANSTGQGGNSGVTIRVQNGTEIGIVMATKPGLRYALQVTSDLSHPEWRAVQEFTGDGSPKLLSEALDKIQTQRYFRLITL